MNEILDEFKHYLFRNGYSPFVKEKLLKALDDMYIDCAISTAEYTYILDRLLKEMYRLERGARRSQAIDLPKDEKKESKTPDKCVRANTKYCDQHTRGMSVRNYQRICREKKAQEQGKGIPKTYHKNSSEFIHLDIVIQKRKKTV